MVENVSKVEKEAEIGDRPKESISKLNSQNDVKIEKMDQWTDRVAILVLGVIGVMIIVFYFLLYKIGSRSADQLLTIVATIAGALAGMVVPNFSKK